MSKEKIDKSYKDEILAAMTSGFNTVMEHIVDLREKMDLGFEQVNARIDRLEERMDRLEARMDKIEGRMDRLEIRIDRLEREISEIKVSIDRIEERTLEDDNALNKEVADLKRRVGFLEKKLELVSR